ncbi:MAG: sugar transferase [Acidimicrobiia bacterium]
MTQSAQTISHPSQQAALAGQAGTTRKRGAYERFVKGVVDRFVGLILAILTLPIVVPVAIAVFIDLGLPILLKQQRVGKNGKVFRVLKFRSMEPDRRAGHVPPFVGSDRRVNHKSEEDPRLTPVGRFIRKWSLDELPQLWNVVFGQMSLVGPRPEMVQIVERYEPWQHARHQVKPGVTGLWQISARGEVPMHEATHIDLEYVDKISLGTDLRILAKTLPAALGSRTGY